MATVKVPCPGFITVGDGVTADGSVPPTVVGNPGAWADDSDSTYAELAETTQPVHDYATCQFGSARVTRNVDLAVVRTHVRYQALSASTGKPMVAITKTAWASDPLFQTVTPGGTGSLTPEWLVSEMTPVSTVALAEFLANPESAHLVVIAPYGSATRRLRILEAYVTVQGPGVAPPGRLFPRDDDLGVGSGRHFPPPKSQQRSGRRFGYY